MKNNSAVLVVSRSRNRLLPGVGHYFPMNNNKMGQILQQILLTVDRIPNLNMKYCVDIWKLYEARGMSVSH